MPSWGSATIVGNEVIEKLAAVFPEIGDAPDRRTVFLKLRELRNRW